MSLISTDTTAEDLKVFAQEVEQLLEMLDEDIIRLEQEAENQDLLQEIFRAAHTLKGSSGMVGFTAMTELTHRMEDLLDRVRKGALQVTPSIVDALLLSLDGLKVLRDDLVAGTDSNLDVTPIIAAIEAAMIGEQAAVASVAALPASELGLTPEQLARANELESAGLRILRASAQIEPSSEWAAVRLFQLLNELGARGEILASVPTQLDIEEERAGHALSAIFASSEAIEVLETALAAVAEVVDARVEAWSTTGASSSALAAEAAPASRPASAPPARDAAAPRIESLSQTVRIDVDKLDELINLVGELVVDRTRFAQVSRSLASRYKEDEQVRALGETSVHVSKVIDALHERMMQVRMLPIGVLFSKFPRLVRDLARSMEKDVTLVVEGEDTEIDRSVIEEIKDPLVHLIRNAVDHGVESREQRAAAGKSGQATVRLVAQHGQGHIVISLSDDGAGISPERIRQAAVDKGLITTETAQRLSDAEAIDLIFAAGFSTAAKTTEVSGRGVGMDIVRSKIESLNGSVEVESQAGQGTTFRLRLPLTLATVRGLLVSINDGTYAIPLAYVREIVRPEATSASGVLGRKAIQLRDDAMPLFDLGDVLRRNGVPGGPAPRAERDDAYVVVVRASESEADRPVALLVDAVLDQQEIVVKSMSAAAGRARGIAGATILGDGEVALILDIPTLVKTAQAASSGSAGVQASRAPERSAA